MSSGNLSMHSAKNATDSQSIKSVPAETADIQSVKSVPAQVEAVETHSFKEQSIKSGDDNRDLQLDEKGSVKNEDLESLLAEDLNKLLQNDDEDSNVLLAFDKQNDSSSSDDHDSEKDEREGDDKEKQASKQVEIKIDRESVLAEKDRRSTMKSVTMGMDFFTPQTHPEARIKEDNEPIRFSITEHSYRLSQTMDSRAVSEKSSLSSGYEEDFKMNIDRNVYYELYTIFTTRQKKEKMKNNFLQAKLAAYYVRRKMTFVLREQQFHLNETQAKYEKELDRLERLIEESDTEKEISFAQVMHLMNKRDAKISDLDEQLEKLLRQEIEYGSSLTFEKTGRNNMDKLVERFAKRQRTHVALTTKLRLAYVKLRNKINEKVEEMEALDHLGPGFRIMDYVQLKSDNRDLHDKFEEKEGELLELRNSCRNTMQVLAHNREKSAVMDLDIEKFQEELETVSAEYEDARENLHFMKRERDMCRNDTNNLKMHNRMFTNRKLLKDFEHAVHDLNELKEQLTNVKMEFSNKDNQLMMVRKNIEYFLHRKNKTNLLQDDDEII